MEIGILGVHLSTVEYWLINAVIVVYDSITVLRTNLHSRYLLKFMLGDTMTMRMIKILLSQLVLKFSIHL